MGKSTPNPVKSITSGIKNVFTGNANSSDWVNLASFGTVGAVTGGLGSEALGSLYGGYRSAEEQKKAEKKLLEEQKAEQSKLESEAKNRNDQALAIAARDAARRLQSASAGSGGRRSTLFSTLGGGMQSLGSSNPNLNLSGLLGR